MAMEHGRILWPSKRGSCLCGGAGNERRLAALQIVKEKGTAAILPQFVVGSLIDHAPSIPYNSVICRYHHGNPAAKDGLSAQRPGRHEALPQSKKLSSERSKRHCSTVLIVGWPRLRGNGCCSCFRQATCTNTCASSAEPLPDPRPSKNAAACYIRRDTRMVFRKQEAGTQARGSGREGSLLRSA